MQGAFSSSTCHTLCNRLLYPGAIIYTQIIYKPFRKIFRFSGGLFISFSQTQNDRVNCFNSLGVFCHNENTAATLVKARWTHLPCTVIWKNYDGTVLETDTNVTYGTVPTYDGAVPVKANDTANEIIYKFAGWTPEVSETYDNTVYTAVYEELPYIHYVDASGNPLTLDVAYSYVTADTTTLTNGWWVVNKNVTNANRIGTGNNVNLLLLDGGTVTAKPGGKGAAIGAGGGMGSKGDERKEHIHLFQDGRQPNKYCRLVLYGRNARSYGRRRASQRKQTYQTKKETSSEVSFNMQH